MAIDFSLSLFTLLNPVYALIGSLIFFIGWAVQVGFWTQCDITVNMEVNGGRDTCYQFWIEKDANNGDLVGVPVTLANAKVAFGFMVFFMLVFFPSVFPEVGIMDC